MDRAWLDALADAILVTDERGVIRRVNAACAQLLGYRPDELIGEPVERLVPERFANHAHQRGAFHSEPQRRRMGFGRRLTALHKSGREIPVDIALSPARLDGADAVVTSLRDMSEPQRLGEILRLQSKALEAAANGVVITDRDGVITWANQAFSRMTGYQREEIIGEHTRVLKSGSHPASFYRELWDTVLAGEIWQGEIINRRRDGSCYPEEQMITPVANDNGEITHFVAIKQDVSRRHAAEQALARAHEELAARLDEIERLNARLREQAIRDPLTGLYNRRYLEETLHREHARSRRTGEPLSLIILDLDHFKRVNDGRGHPAGDRVLQAVAALLTAGVRESDLACRYGGEEFVIALPGASAADAQARAETLRQRIADLVVDVDDSPISITASAGVAQVDEDIDAALERADRALYAAKGNGRNRVVVG